jgi:hypothetical protein
MVTSRDAGKSLDKILHSFVIKSVSKQNRRGFLSLTKNIYANPKALFLFNVESINS